MWLCCALQFALLRRRSDVSNLGYENALMVAQAENTQVCGLLPMEEGSRIL
jgi:hypothetical protein